MKKRTLLLLTAMALTLGLSGCGGGGGSTSDNTPVINTPTDNTPADNTPVASGDTTKPIVTIEGSSDMTLEQFTHYAELGATAVDDTDGNLTVDIVGAVNTSTPNVYVIQYSATDAASNVGIAERYVSVTSPLDTNKTQIDVLALYSQGVDDLYNNDSATRISHLVSATNQIGKASRSGVHFNLVSTQKWVLDDEDNSMNVLSSVADDVNARNLRDSLLADEIVIFRPYANDDMCGLAYLNAPPYESVYVAHVSVDCGSKTMAHEVGHNLGLDHGYMSNGDAPHLTGIYPSSSGHLVAGVFGTIMTYSEESYGTPAELVYSNPDLECKVGEPCGVAVGEFQEADAVSTILETRAAMAGVN